ncbi:Fe(3+) ABC transporter substrate-binding protein [Marinomonas pollencensis]|uniref:Iron(III) transport system substrate-binding protein n=1 Tax=Marinomonas pollencensis TaxID=491954 RepID=A0A3E0DGK2_9GAMM|nr:Fe(3+) ABC transporter substrate-binding protein [Marinomonas pollencensis]REG81817.1 iron(III) transport system substrate-binding protein [Marinomonas pollencensis]
MAVHWSIFSSFSASSRLPHAALAASILTASISASAAQEVNVYSARKEALIKPMLDRFTADTDIKVNLVTGSADALLRRLQVEGSASPADVFITVDAGRLYRAKKAGVLQPIQDAELEATIPANLKDSDDYWFGLSQRARVIFYNPQKVSASELSTYEALADKKWQGRICARSSSNIYNQSLVASMIDADGQAATAKWLKGFVANFARPPFGGDSDLLKAAAAGVCDITLANTYYFGRMGNSDKAQDQAVFNKLAIFWPNQGENQRGAHVNVSGAGVTAAAEHKDNAVKLIRYLSSHDAQQWYADVNNEYPVVKGIKAPAVLQTFGSFKADSLSLSVLGDNNRLAVKLMDEAGWK